jgi:RNA 2',3'-cyclic 3'-phosphodiesterase
MRTFIAIEIPEETRQGLRDAQQVLRTDAVDAGWPKPEGIHLTLKFLGEVPDARIPEITNALTAAATGTGRFRLAVQGTGTFPNARNARVVWAGVSGEIETLNRLQAAVEDAMERAGFERENRPFTPHLTLGRIKYIRSRETWTRALDQVKDLSLPAFDVTSFILMKSELKRTGAEYAQIAKIELK